MASTAYSPVSGPHVAPLSGSDLAFNDPALDELVRTLGYHPNALLTMARRPGLLRAVLGLLRIVVWSKGSRVAWIPMSNHNSLSCTENAFSPQIGIDCIGIGKFYPLVARSYQLHFACFYNMSLKLPQSSFASQL